MFKYLISFPILFPYIGFIDGIDLQPFFIVSFCLFFLMFGLCDQYKINMNILVILFAGATIITSLAFRFPDLWILDRLIIPLVFIFLLMISYTMRKPLNSIFTQKFIVRALYAYIFVGIVQVYEPTFLTFLTARDNGIVGFLVESGRGVRSLCAEPAQFGRTLVAFNALVFLTVDDWRSGKQKILKYTIICFLATLLLSRSLYAIIIHLVFISSVLFVVGHRNYLWSLFGTFVLFCCVLSIFILFPDSRAVILVKKIVENIEILKNYGAFNRVVNIYVSSYFGFSEGIFGFASKVPVYLDFWNLTFATQQKFHGGLVDLVYRFGLVGVLIIIIVFSLVWFSNESLGKKFLVTVYLVTNTLIYGPILEPFFFLILARIGKTKDYA